MYGEAGTAEGPPPAGGSPTRTNPLITINSTIQEESDRREGKGRRCWLGDGIDSNPCRT